MEGHRGKRKTSKISGAAAIGGGYQFKGEEMSASEAERKNILKQMKVRTTYKKDKSWINQQNSEDERDEIPSPISPQLKSLEGRKSLWSPTPDSKPERNSGSFTAKEIITTSSSPPVQSVNKQFSYSANESNKSSSTSQPSPPSSTTGANNGPVTKLMSL
ncbi:unnamed protein product [Ranitomeya imitator]|uniref:Uncharacterized protein n=1 Tax=Ranitomeya imitator TaxID=111125 RepID=A0ABN9LXV2_9NEOB|nr:unnamed protein product [Ranitomeya imitator]